MKRFISVLIALTAFVIFCVPASAYSAGEVIPTATANKMLDDYRKALKNGESYVDLSKYGVVNDSGYNAYNYFLELLYRLNGEMGCISFGKYSEPYVTNEIKVSSGIISGVALKYSDRYRKADGTCDIALAEKDQELVADRFAYAKSLTRRSMSDVEKALQLYDFIITISDYPEPIGKDEDGEDLYPDDSYTAVGLLRDGVAVCAANAKVYAILLNECGIPALTVQSHDMKHEWVLLKVDGEWYHADPTWDDPNVTDGYTMLWDENNDSWDRGAVTHSYFLKSDEEIEVLEHTNFEVSYAVNPDFTDTLPASGRSGAFDDMFFSDKNEEYTCYTAMNCINGNWYFADLKTGTIIRTTADGEAESLPLPGNDIPKYCFRFGNDLYVSSDFFIYRFDTVSDKYTPIMSIPADKRETMDFSEMSIRFNEMNVVTADYTFNSDGEVLDVSFESNTYDMSDVEEMEAVADDTALVPEEDEETVTRSAEDSEPVSITQPGRRTDTGKLSEADKELIDMAESANKRVTAFVYLGIAVLFLVLGVVAVILAIKYRKKK